MSAIISRLALPIRRPPCSSPRPIEAASIPSGISSDIPGFSKPMPMRGSTRSASRSAGRGPIIEAACWAHARRKFFELTDIASKARGKISALISPIAFEAVQKIDAVFMLERASNGLSPQERPAARRNDVASLARSDTTTRLYHWQHRGATALT
jgi:hypothetical protein